MENQRKGYQRLEMDFFRLSKIRRLNASTSLFYLYLRGLYCRFGKPVFYCGDKFILQDLPITQNTLRLARIGLQQKGLLLYKSGGKKNQYTEYKLLQTSLLPVLKIRSDYPENKDHHSLKQGVPIINNSKDKVKNKSNSFHTRLQTKEASSIKDILKGLSS